MVSKNQNSKIDKILYEFEQKHLLVDAKGHLRYGMSKLILMRLKDRIEELTAFNASPSQILYFLQSDYFVKNYISKRSFYDFFQKYIRQ